MSGGPSLYLPPGRRQAPALQRETHQWQEKIAPVANQRSPRPERGRADPMADRPTTRLLPRWLRNLPSRARQRLGRYAQRRATLGRPPSEFHPPLSAADSSKANSPESLL